MRQGLDRRKAIKQEIEQDPKTWARTGKNRIQSQNRRHGLEQENRTKN
jgi:hypothetical protein